MLFNIMLYHSGNSVMFKQMLNVYMYTNMSFTIQKMQQENAKKTKNTFFFNQNGSLTIN